MINAIRLSAYPRKLSRAHLYQLSEHGLTKLGRARQIKRTLLDGMTISTFLMLADELFVAAAPLAGGHFRLRLVLRGQAGLTSTAALTALRRSVDRNQPVLITLRGSYNHWTVIAGYSTARFALFDSAGFKWVKAGSIVIEHEAGQTPHWIERSATFALTFTPIATRQNR